MKKEYRMLLSHLNGETIYRNFRYIKDEEGIAHKEFAPGIYENAAECFHEMERLNAQPRRVTDEEARASLIEKAKAKRREEISAKQWIAFAQLVTIGSLFTLLCYMQV